MKILLTGGNEALQRSVADACVAAGHSVHVALTAPDATRVWSARVEPLFVADMSADTLTRALRGCEVAVALSPALSPSSSRSEAGSIDRTLEAAGRAGVTRLVVVTTLEDRSARSSGAAINGARVTSIVIRTALPYGIGDDVVTLFLILMRSLPAVPLVRSPAVFQPVWHEDLSRCVAASVSSSAPAGVFTIAGPDAVEAAGLYDRIAMVIDRHPARIPVPAFVATFGRRLAEALSLPVRDVAARFGDAASLGPPPERVSVSTPFAELVRTSLDEGLRRLIERLSEVTPQEGVGTLQVKTFSTTVSGTTHGAAAIMSLLRERFADVMPVGVGVEPAAPIRSLALGSVLTIALPGRGHVQIRVVDVQPTQTTVATLRGHTVAGIVRFSASPTADGTRFEVLTCDRAANAADWVGLTLGGSRLQDANWTTVVTNVARLSGGQPSRVHVDSRRLFGNEARKAEELVAKLVHRSQEMADAERVGTKA